MNPATEKPYEEDLYIAKEKFQIILSNYLFNRFNKNVYCKCKGSSLDFNLNNNYSLSIDMVNNELLIYGTISSRESTNFEAFENQYTNKDFIPILMGEKGMVEAIGVIYKKKLSQHNFNNLAVWEKRIVAESTAEFIDKLSAHKEDCYNKSKGG